MLVLVSEKLDNSMKDYRISENSVQWHSDSLKSLLKTKDLCSFKKLLKSTLSFTNNSTKKKKLLLSLHTHSAQMNKDKFYQLWKPILKMQAKNLWLNSKLMKQLLVDFKCTLSLNSWTWVSHPVSTNLARRFKRWLIDCHISFYSSLFKKNFI